MKSFSEALEEVRIAANELHMKSLEDAEDDDAVEETLIVTTDMCWCGATTSAFSNKLCQAYGFMNQWYMLKKASGVA
jgi:hypothetical protein